MLNFIGEFLGTFILILLVNGVSAGVSLNKTKTQYTGWVMIALGCGLAVTVAAYVSSGLSGAHLNPAVTIARAIIGDLAWSQVPIYLVAQVCGALLGAVATYFHYYPHWKETSDPSAILGCFATSPAIRHMWSNLFSEVIGTAVLMISILAVDVNKISSNFGPLIIGVVVISIGFSLGGTTGYAINPARDFGPRLAHQILPIPNKGGSDWSYAWIPVVGPIIGGALGALFYQCIL